MKNTAKQFYNIKKLSNLEQEFLENIQNTKNTKNINNTVIEIDIESTAKNDLKTNTEDINSFMYLLKKTLPNIQLLNPEKITKINKLQNKLHVKNSSFSNFNNTNKNTNNNNLSDQYRPKELPLKWCKFLNEITDILPRLENQQWVSTATIDLHFHTLEQARKKVHDFIIQSFHHKHKCVTIITGIGQSPQYDEDVMTETAEITGRIRIHTLVWLIQLERYVRAYCPVPFSDGGAFLILLHRS